MKRKVETLFMANEKIEKGNFLCEAFVAKLSRCTTLSEQPAFGKDAGASYRLKFTFHLRLWGLSGFWQHRRQRWLHP